MKAIDNGSLFSVSISAAEVAKFKENWPCSGIPCVRIWAQFDKRNGDLVDLEPSNLEEKGADGRALLALLQDAQNFAAKKLDLPEICFRR